jgi:hypothetical protein
MLRTFLPEKNFGDGSKREKNLDWPNKEDRVA